MALKMACAGMFTALVLENMCSGLCVPVYAEDEEMDGYTDSAEWNDFYDYWGGVADDALNNYVATADPALQSQYLTLVLAGNFAIANMEYQKNARALVDPDWNSPDTPIPAGRIACGWYYRANKPYSAIAFGYGDNNDPAVSHGGTAVLISANDFTVSANITPNDNVAFPSIMSSESNLAYYLSCTGCNITSLSCSGIISNDLSNYTNPVVWYRPPFNDRVVTLDNVSYNLSAFANSGTLGQLIIYAGLLKDTNGNPISNSRQAFIRASVGNNFPDFLLDLKQQLDDNFPEEVVNELWYDPTQGEPLPDTGSLDSLTFPPGLPSVQFNDVELPSEPLPAKALQGAGFWFTSFTNMLDALGVKYIVITFLIIALILAILKI